MTETSNQDSEARLAAAASDLCEHEIAREDRRDTSLLTVFATALFATMGLALALRISWALLTSIWIWAAIVGAAFYSGRAPKLFGFGAVTGMFEDSHHHFIEGQFTRFVKTLRYRPRG